MSPDEGMNRMKIAGEVLLPGPRRAQGMALTPSPSVSKRALAAMRSGCSTGELRTNCQRPSLARHKYMGPILRL